MRRTQISLGSVVKQKERGPLHNRSVAELIVKLNDMSRSRMTTTDKIVQGRPLAEDDVVTIYGRDLWIEDMRKEILSRFPKATIDQQNAVTNIHLPVSTEGVLTSSPHKDIGASLSVVSVCLLLLYLWLC